MSMWNKICLKILPLEVAPKVVSLLPSEEIERGRLRVYIPISAVKVSYSVLSEYATSPRTSMNIEKANTGAASCQQSNPFPNSPSTSHFLILNVLSKEWYGTLVN